MKETMITDNNERNWAMYLHLSLLAGYVIPFAGLVAPIVIWQLKKETMPSIDPHGKVVANWLLSLAIYFAIATVSLLFFVGFILLPLLAIVNVAFAIIGGIKANEGEVWPYPGSIRFFDNLL